MDPLLIDIPSELVTDRLILRAPQPGDGAATNAAIAESISELRPWMIWAQNIPTIEESEAFARRCHAKFLAREDLHFRAWLKGTNTLIVGCGLHRIDWTVPKFEIGYWVRSSFAGQGYVTEAVNALTHVAFDTLNAERVEIRADVLNVRSHRVAERAGFTLEGILRRDSRGTEGELRDTRIYAKIRQSL